MANYSVAKAKHATTVAATVDTITLTNPGSGTLMVVNRSAAEVLYFTIDGSTPASVGDDTFVVPSGQTISVGGNVPVVKVISAGACAYSVVAI